MKNILTIISLTLLLSACGGGGDDNVISGGGQAGVEQYAGRYVGTFGMAGTVQRVFLDVNRSGRMRPSGPPPGCLLTDISGYQVNKKGNFTFAEEYRCYAGVFAGCSRIRIAARGSINSSGFLSAKGTMRLVCSRVGLNGTEPYEIQARRQ